MILPDDLFAPERDDDVFNDGSDNLFSDKKGLFDEQVSTNLWKDRPIKSYKSNIIPASIDVPPPISIVCTYFYTFVISMELHVPT